jgi:polyhydroxyalkanoate synthesis regulator phasin
LSERKWGEKPQGNNPRKGFYFWQGRLNKIKGDFMLSAAKAVNTSEKRAYFDEVINTIDEELNRGTDIIFNLIHSLEAPGVQGECGKQPKCQPQTIQQAFQDLYSRMVNNHDALQQTVNRIREQVGELKILP